MIAPGAVGRLRALAAQGRGLAGHTVWAAGGDLITLFSSLLVFYLLTTRLGPSGYGYYIGAQVLVATLATFSSSAASMLLLQEIVREKRPLAEVWSGCLALTLVTGTAALALSLPLTAMLLPGLSLGVMALLAAGQFFGAGLVTLAAAFEQSQGRLPRGVVLNGSVNTVRAGSVLLLALSGNFSLLSVAAAICLVNLVFGLGSVAILRLRYLLPLRPRLPGLNEARRGLSYAGALILFAIQEDADKILLVRLADAASNGLYSAAYRIVQMATLPVRALVAASHPTFLQHDEEQIGQHVRRTVRITAAACAYAVLASVVLVAMAPLLDELLGDVYSEAVFLIYLLTPLVLLRASSLFAVNALMGLGRNGVRVGLAGIGAAVNVVANVVLILEYGVVGAAAATLGSEVVFTLLAWCALIRCQRQHDAGVRERLADSLTADRTSAGG